MTSMTRTIVELILERPGITAPEISEIMEAHIDTVWRHLQRVMDKYPALHQVNNGGEEVEIFLLERRKGSHSPYQYTYKRLRSLPINSQNL